MALRMFLVAMVVAMSLPMPNSGSCNQAFHDLKAEFSAVVGSIQNEWPLAAPLKRVTEMETAQATEPPAQELPKPVEEKPVVIESPLELAFSVIVEEFARDAASHLSVDEARNHVAVIPMPDMNHPLPPAPEANELIDHQETLVLINPPTPSVHRLEAPLGRWEMETVCLPTDDEPARFLEVVETIRVVSLDIGPWADVDVAVETKSAAEQAKSDQPRDMQVVAPLPVPELWLEIADISQMATLESPAPEPAKSPVVISRAIQLTAQALAAWTQVVVRPY